jgi:heme/copper-type cytochrome/quinol oxidase subunit 1
LDRHDRAQPQTHLRSAMMFVNLIGMWGHPEVYALVLPAFGIVWVAVFTIV